jgi:FKBP-type peptidyl-prolyl cis-trans isomerase
VVTAQAPLYNIYHPCLVERVVFSANEKHLRAPNKAGTQLKLNLNGSCDDVVVMMMRCEEKYDFAKFAKVLVSQSTMTITTTLFTRIITKATTTTANHALRYYHFSSRNKMGLTKEVLKVGNGQKPTAGQEVSVHCTGYGKNRDLTKVFWCK